jgi:hypothetical protein
VTTNRRPITSRQAAGVAWALGLALLLPGAASAGVRVFEKDDFTLELGMRLQPRVTLDMVLPSGGTERQWQRDFLVRRSRWKANGKMLGATYVFEWRIDGVDGITPADPNAVAENAYIQYAFKHGISLRAGLYDQPFSRDRLTSDSKQLVVDRGNVSTVPAAFGLADNATGLQLMSKLAGGHADLTVGVFDNRTLTAAAQDDPMVVGRLDLNLGQTSDIFQDAHFGDQSWYSLGVDGSYQNTDAADYGSYAAVGVDGMVDIPAGPGRAFAKAEFNTVQRRPTTGGNPVDTRTWMAGFGYLIRQRFQPNVRFDEVQADDGSIVDVTYVGANYYQKGHGLKVQGDVRFESGTHESVDGFRLQGQIDF